MKLRRIQFRLHAIRRMFGREISDEEVLKVIREGEVIEEYPNDEPYPSMLILGFVNDRPIHVVLAVNEEESMGIVVTAYQPDPSLWRDNFRRRRKP
ncbi:MAG: DUF4258 domain-containing protein [Candidatus Marinimicrobia bacterium]|nr:DUF4258 domain-containing protein [Candidatus Neomarinimicrobiota bacterium]